jgi:hypothetical protein
MAKADVPAIESDRRLRSVGRVLLGVSFALLVQFLLGVVINLFVVISKTHLGAGVADYFVGASESFAWAVTSKWPFLALHALLGLGFVINTVVFLVRGRRQWRTVLWALNAVAFLAVTFAASNGLYFLIHPDVDLASLFMATGFAIAIGSVIVSIYIARRGANAVAGA